MENRIDVYYDLTSLMIAANANKENIHFKQIKTLDGQDRFISFYSETCDKENLCYGFCNKER